MRKLERLKCSQCSTRLGEKQGSFFVYPNPLICPQCGADNTANIKPHLIGTNSELRQSEQPQAAPQQPEAPATASADTSQPLCNALQPQAGPADGTSTGGGGNQPQADQNDDRPQRTPGEPLGNPRHEAFCQNFALRKCSATRAYLDAGFGVTDESARRLASVLLTNIDVLNRISELQTELARKAVEVAHWDREERIARLQRRATALDEIIAARALETENWAAAGGHTGHIVRQFKVAGGMMVDEYSVDLGLLKELRAIEQQIAQELGEWLTKTAVQVSDIPTLDVPENASIEDIRAMKARMIGLIEEFKQKPAQSVQ